MRTTGRLIPLFNHDPKTAPVIGQIVEKDGRKVSVLHEPYNQDPVLVAHNQILQSLLDENEPS